ncbi:MAG: dTDP-4-dehydrorhamnose reductase [Coriobacteriales bacterium]|nr:dTDP-4-dehydrorhamnose reductase [Coriobacteriales bacterium]
MRILITGSKGQLGNELQRILSTGRADIGPIPEEYLGETEVCATDVDTLDILDEEAVEDMTAETRPELIINCAAYTNVDACESHPDLAFRLNAEGASILARAAQKQGATLVHVSTDYVFSGTDPRARIESDLPDPQSVYGKTKLAGEQLVAEISSSCHIVRTAWLYGLVGNNFVKTILGLARKNGRIQVVDDQFGNPTNANDLAYEILRIAQSRAYGIWHCTNEGSCSWFDFASEIVDQAGVPCEKLPCTTEEFPRPAPRPRFSSLENARLQALLGNEMRPWREALRSYLGKL